MTMPNCDPKLKCCPTVNGVHRAGHYPWNCILNGTVNIGRKGTQRVSAVAADDSVMKNLLSELDTAKEEIASLKTTTTPESIATPHDLKKMNALLNMTKFTMEKIHDNMDPDDRERMREIQEQLDEME